MAFTRTKLYVGDKVKLLCRNRTDEGYLEYGTILTIIRVNMLSYEAMDSDGHYTYLERTLFGDSNQLQCELI